MSASTSKSSTARTYYVGIDIIPSRPPAGHPMLRVPRSSALHRSIERDEEDDQDAQDVTNILNEEAANANRRTSSRKRKRMSNVQNDGETPAKKQKKPQEPPAATPQTSNTSPNRRRSNRLQARKSITAPTPFDKRQPFEIPVEDEAAEPEQAPLKAVKKLRVLNKPAKNTASPFKNFGELTTDTNARVNLDESPRKRGRPPKNTDTFARIAKIAKSLRGKPSPAKNAPVLTELLDEGDTSELQPIGDEGSLHGDANDFDHQIPGDNEDDDVEDARTTQHHRRKSKGITKDPACQPCRLARRRCNRGTPCRRCINEEHPELCSYDQPAETVSPKPNLRASDAEEVEPTHKLHVPVTLTGSSKSPRRPVPGSRPGSKEGARPAQAQQDRHPTTRVENALAQAARRTEANEDLPPSRNGALNQVAQSQQNTRHEDAEDGDSGDGEGSRDTLGRSNAGDQIPDIDDAGTENDEPAATAPQVQVHRRQTEAEKGAAQLAKDEAEARRQELAAEGLSGIEVAVQLHGCQDCWTNALVAAAEIAQDRASTQVTSTIGRACEREFKNMTLVYKSIARQDRPSKRLDPADRESLDRLQERCAHLGRKSQPRDERRDPERRKMVQDIYEYLIPRSLKLAKWALRARYRNDRLSSQAMEEICELLTITYALIETARTWMPRPQLESGVKSTTHSDIKPRVDFLIKRYRGVIHERGLEDWVDEKAQRAAENLRRQKEEHRKWQESRLARYNRQGTSSQRTGVQTRQISSNPRPLVADIDDIVADEPPTSSHHRIQHDPPANNPATAYRPRQVLRDMTRETPAPSEPPLSGEEMDTLLRALRKFRHNLESRWDDILEFYGGPGGVFEMYDVDQIIAMAKWMKQTMARSLEYELDHSWDWLRSVPD
ncbi:hypothetical protein H2200_002595 [Cladophialophora chaetospira]|uniref:Zn(2)-C6 fungal-type domain-containing protein n=1 Tax=Cladophialophora chaetospira TaxID=386627 RepID=A0AA38XJA3_9EURO|nr:hypothetical protein H2200_002595 [Cladophialophora chaetospira]